MILGVDIGNSNIVVSVIDTATDAVLVQHRIESTHLTTEACRTALSRILRSAPAALDGSIIASVVPALSDMVGNVLHDFIGQAPLVVSVETRSRLRFPPFRNITVGADLIVAAAAAIDRFPLPAVLVDLGTATTVMAVDAARFLRGGAILPGVHVSGTALVDATALLPNVPLTPPGHVIGQSTEECIQIGLLYGAAAAIDGLVTRMEEELGTSATVVATGGFSSLIVPLCRRAMILEPNLLPIGLSILYKNESV
ncbi:MAG: type III pantothenate kinase [Oscillospiraceae bacterium]|nr:type III pantothenate kinase [Oscillospiraceae bacterium]